MRLAVEGFEDLAEIGRGGFGVVYRARQPAFRRVVAIKVLPSADLDEQARARFEREAQAMGSVSGHPNIVIVHAAGFTDDGRPYLVMPYLSRGSLADRLTADGGLPTADAVALAVKLAGALETAHAAGVLHRDIKPDNVLFTDWGEPQLTDFGIARVEGAMRTRTGAISASLPYAPPEVIAGRPPTPAAEVYSLASTLYAALCGRAPFTVDSDESLAPLLARITMHDPPDLRRRGVPDPVWQVLAQALAKDPEERPRTAAAFGGALQEAQRRAGLPVTEMALPERVAAGDTGSATTRRVGPAVPGPREAPDSSTTAGRTAGMRARARDLVVLGLTYAAISLLVRAILRSIPDLGDNVTITQVRDYRERHPGQLGTAWALAMVALPAYALFLWRVRAVVRRVEGRRTGRSRAVTTGAVGVIALQTLTQAAYLGFLLDVGDINALFNLGGLADFASYFLLAAFVLGTSLSGLRSGLLPNWLGYFGATLALVGTASLLLLVPGLVAAGQGLDTVALGYLAWVAAVAMTVGRNPQVTDAPAPRP
jgi:hypothetical protein